jgi:hypothetical protein
VVALYGWFRKKFQKGLLFDTYILYVCNKELHFSKIDTWYSSILYIMDELKIRSIHIKLSHVRKQVKDNMCNSFLVFWNGEIVDATGSNRGRLDTYFYIKTHFGKEKYLEINNFKI